MKIMNPMNPKNPEAVKLANPNMISNRRGVVLRAMEIVDVAAQKEMASRSFGLSQMAANFGFAANTLAIVEQADPVVTEADAAAINLAVKAQASAVVEQAEAITAAVPPSIPASVPPPIPSNITPVDGGNEQSEDSLDLADVRSKVNDIFNSFTVEEERSF